MCEYVCAHVLICYVFSTNKILCILDKMDNRMMPSVVHYGANAKCIFLSPKSILYMLFTGVAHPMGLTCWYYNMVFKTFSQFVCSFYYCRVTNFMIMEPESEPQLRPRSFSCQVNSYIISSIDVFWPAAPPGLCLFWVYVSLFQLFGPLSQHDSSSTVKFLLCIAWYCMYFHARLEIQSMYFTISMNIFNTLSCGIHFPTITGTV